MGVPILSGCGFVVGVGWRYGPGASGGSLGVGFLGGSALGLRLGLYGVLVTLGCCFSGGYMRLLLGMPVPADVGCQPGGRTVPGWSGGGLGFWGALPPGWGYGWAWGAWVLVGVPPEAWVGACAGPGSGVGVFDASVPPRGGGGGGGGCPIEAG